MNIFLDVDGTLVNSFPGISRCAQLTFADLGYPVPTLEQLHSFPGPPLEITLGLFGMKAEDIPRAVATFRGYYHDFGWQEAELFPGWAEALPRWKAAGHTICTATSKDEDMARQMLTHLGVADNFDFIGGADDATGSRPTKRHVIEWVLDSMNLRGHEERILMVGDRHHDVEGARPLGIRTALVAWGHGSQAEFDDAEFFVSSVEDIDALLAAF
ncbi:HAD hydrolase-like protein [Corynebacterium striatum]|uniref:HAD hydrolase-like protein n=1 Tax=Corynebacterium TaxID=1716 RepID=UPI0011C7F778|nr:MULTISPECIES: HAD hydrolase-like protein [Corynebacterium]QQU79290.1 HAD hydrolase-like protein [Corynebacterium striatum]TXS64571.1 phosphoglycolate phosphatase [Corynebacterium sp. LK14]HAT1181296.1 HAD hydrolase-like protein [Corynebacterium striatum]HAT6617712.1 HAD hydrolase-like protein [Corynebacterium striatum]